MPSETALSTLRIDGQRLTIAPPRWGGANPGHLHQARPQALAVDSQSAEGGFRWHASSSITAQITPRFD